MRETAAYVHVIDTIPLPLDRNVARQIVSAIPIDENGRRPAMDGPAAGCRITKVIVRITKQGSRVTKVVVRITNQGVRITKLLSRRSESTSLVMRAIRSVMRETSSVMRVTRTVMQRTSPVMRVTSVVMEPTSFVMRLVGFVMPTVERSGRNVIAASRVVAWASNRSGGRWQLVRRVRWRAASRRRLCR